MEVACSLVLGLRCRHCRSIGEKCLPYLSCIPAAFSSFGTNIVYGVLRVVLALTMGFTVNDVIPHNFHFAFLHFALSRAEHPKWVNAFPLCLSNSPDYHQFFECCLRGFHLRGPVFAFNLNHLSLAFLHLLPYPLFALYRNCCSE